jgi:hypothetical protein
LSTSACCATIRGVRHDPSSYQVDLHDARGVVVGDQNLVIQHFTAGLAALSTDFESRIANFWMEYLGSAERPVAFGGRDSELLELDRWLADSEKSNLLIAAAAGRGKSSLIVRWLARLAGRDDLDVAFVPVSARFRTNPAAVFFPALAARVAALGEVSLPVAVGAGAEAWRGVLSGLLRERGVDSRTLLVVVDSLDEAADWEAGPDLFPLAPPASVRVLVSARLLAGDVGPDAWLERLGWNRPGLADTLALPPLDRRGIAAVVEQAGLRRDDGVDLTAELQRLTEGEPLLLHLYVDHLSGSGQLTVRDLPLIPPGLSAYFDRWWDEQRKLWGAQTPLREAAVKALLGLAAAALGPLTRDDLLALEPELDRWALEDALQPLRRFLIGDGVRQGFAYSHPRLAAHFLDGFATAERDGLEERFLGWCDRSAQASAPLPAYVSEHYTRHLARAGRATELYRLIGDPTWAETQLAADPSCGALTADVQRAWAVADAHDDLEQQVRCGLTVATVHSLSHNIPPAVLAALVELGAWKPQQALRAARQNPDVQERAVAVATLVRLLADEREQEIAAREAVDTLRAPEIHESTFGAGPDLLGRIAANLPARLLPLAVEAAESAFPDQVAEAMAALLPTLSGELRAAALRKIRDYLERAPAPLGDWSDDHWTHTDIAKTVLGLVDEPERSEIADVAVAAAQADPDPQWRVKRLAWLAGAVGEPRATELTGAALALLPQIK